MTQRRDLKRRVRERQARTGESYVTALRHVRAERDQAAGATEPPGAAEAEAAGAEADEVEAAEAEAGEAEAGPADATGPSGGAIPVVELVDLSDVAASLGLSCRVMVMPTLIDRVDPRAMLVQLRGVLRTTAGDPAFSVLRAAVLLGRRPHLERNLMRTRVPRLADDTLQFAARVRAGVGGVSSNGRMLALSVPGRGPDTLVVFSLWQVPLAYDPRPPALLVTTPDQLSVNIRFDLERTP